MGDPSVTLDQVAERAGVSRQTVSNALRHPERLAARTRARVLDAIREAGYQPSLPARQLATRKAHAIAVRADRKQDGISGLVLDAFFHGLAEAGHREGLRVVLYAEQADEAAELTLVEELLLTRAADAVVLTATTAEDRRPTHLREAGRTFCAFGRPWGAGVPPHDWVDVDGAQGTRLAVEHLLERGARRIAFLGWPEHDGTGADRRRGWSEALVAAGVTGARLERSCVNDSLAAQAAAGDLFVGPDRADAVVCASDTLALGAFRAARASSDGESVQVVGFDATPVAAALGMPSVSQPIGEVALRCLDLLVPRLGGADPAPRGLLIPPTLHVPT